MIAATGWWLVVKPLDLRCGMDRLLLFVKSELGRDGFDGGAYVFRNRSGSRMKVLCCDAQGVWLCTRRLHEGSFVWPKPGAPLCELSRAQFDWLVAGVDWQRLSARIAEVPRVL